MTLPWDPIEILIKKTDKFYRNALWMYFLSKKSLKKEAQTFHMPDDDEEPFSGRPNVDVLSEADKFDIKDEELFNQFESFMNGYRELVNSLHVDPQHLTPDAMEHAGDLITTLNHRWERILKNPYLNMNEAEGWDEDFDPGEFTDFVQKVVEDAGNQLAMVAGQDIDVDDMKAARMANTFNALTEDERKGEKEAKWSAEKIQKALEYRKTYFNKLMFIKKVGKSHPDYQMYENYIATRKKAYHNIMSDPERASVYKAKALQRHSKYRAFEERKEEIRLQMERTTDKEELARLEAQLEKISRVEAAYRSRAAKAVEKIQQTKGKDEVSRQITEGGTLEALIIKLNQNIANIKMGIKKEITKNLADQEDTTFKPYKDKIAQAKASGNAAALKAATQELQAALNKHAESNATLVEYVNASKPFYEYRDALKTIWNQGWMNESQPVEEIKSHLMAAIAMGEKLAMIPDRTWSIPNKTTRIILRHVIDALKQRIA